ncbi:hypothetical protein DFH08DRAFT_798914 [Mycena albidolilacea]|uniref:Uncharacterized protein n=1 Tax=Mycena albidolilacea TaxID=1033008 RepID=A0AAD7F478_9AGAR|nr:hypothetical protein DFH08DRAFT_798914 [Mycena albidolilacea]
MRIILGLIIPGVGLTAVLLALYGYAAWNVVSRRYLNRYVVIYIAINPYTIHHASFVFGVSFPMAALGGYPDWRCSLLSFLSNSSIMFSGCIFFCTALNIPLVVVFNFNGQAMEKYYVAGTTLICLICNVSPYASGNIGWDATAQACWYNNPDPEARFRWLIGTQTSWAIIFVVGELSAFLIIVGYLIAHEIHLLRRPACTETTYSSGGAGSTILRFRNIILRIGLYPLVSCLVNITVTMIDLREFRKHKMEVFESTKLDMILMLVALATCAGRPLIYGLLAATDPSFIRALCALRHPAAEPETQFYSGNGCLSTIVDIPPHEVSSLDNGHARPERMPARESSAARERALAVGKEWQSYLVYETSGTTTSVSTSQPTPPPPRIDVRINVRRVIASRGIEWK